MTELQAQAKDYAMSRKLNLSEPTDITHVIGLLENAYIAGAEPREKRIEELEEENRQLRNEVEDLTAYCNQIGKIKTGVLKLFEHVVAR